jgi:hypothetical protein
MAGDGNELTRVLEGACEPSMRKLWITGGPEILRTEVFGGSVWSRDVLRESHLMRRHWTENGYQNGQREIS